MTTLQIRDEYPEARGVEGLFHHLASRIGAVPEGSEVPRTVRQQCWSLANVPLMWGASGNADSTPALDWLMGQLGGCQSRLSSTEAESQRETH